jgi:lycopene cyclase domain-containing protein
VRHLVYLGVLATCLLCAGWLEPAFKLRVRRRARRLLRVIGPVVVVFSLWDVAAIAAGHWRYDPAQLIGAYLPGHLPLEEVLFFVVVPVCAVLGFEAVRSVTGWSTGPPGSADDRAVRPDGGSAPPDQPTGDGDDAP